jgi:alkylation response protein AidB-like acyl-CoA dehydrogenase
MIVTDLPEHRELRSAVRKLLEQESPIDRVVADASSNLGYDRMLWRRLAQEIGVAGLSIPERFGGSGASAHEDAIVAEEFGRSLACTPYLSTVALAVNLLLASGDEGACTQFLPTLAAGEQTATVVYRATDGSVSAAGLPIEARGETLNGTATFVLDGHSADVLLIVARSDEGVALFAVDGTAAGVHRGRLTTLDHTRVQARVSFEDVVGTPIGRAGDAWPWLELALLRATVSLAAEQVGGADHALASAVDYAKLRVQFGRAIGSFQAIKHRCAEIAVSNDRARSAMLHATWSAAAGDEQFLQEAAAMAAVVCGPAFVYAAQESIHLHGGIGFTWEHPAHRYFRRAKADLFALDTPHSYQERLLVALGA